MLYFWLQVTSMHAAIALKMTCWLARAGNLLFRQLGGNIRGDDGYTYIVCRVAPFLEKIIDIFETCACRPYHGSQRKPSNISGPGKHPRARWLTDHLDSISWTSRHPMHESASWSAGQV